MTLEPAANTDGPTEQPVRTPLGLTRFRGHPSDICTIRSRQVRYLNPADQVPGPRPPAPMAAGVTGRAQVVHRLRGSLVDLIAHDPVVPVSAEQLPDVYRGAHGGRGEAVVHHVRGLSWADDGPPGPPTRLTSTRAVASPHGVVSNAACRPCRPTHVPAERRLRDRAPVPVAAKLAMTSGTT